MSDNKTFVIAMLLACLLGAFGFGSYSYVGWLNYQRDIEIERIERETKLKQTEERAKAWHVPWGGKGIEEEPK